MIMTATFVEEKSYIERFINELRLKIDEIKDPKELEKFKKILRKFEEGLKEEYEQPFQTFFIPRRNSGTIKKTRRLNEEVAIVELNDNTLKKRVFSIHAIHEIMKNLSNYMVSKDAVECLIENLEKLIIKTVEFAVKILQNNGKRKITKEEINLAIKYALNE